LFGVVVYIHSHGLLGHQYDEVQIRHRIVAEREDDRNNSLAKRSPFGEGMDSQMEKNGPRSK
jgi:hypothetical protein